jgi:hypothetical protein
MPRRKPKQIVTRELRIGIPKGPQVLPEPVRRRREATAHSRAVGAMRKRLIQAFDTLNLGLVVAGRRAYCLSELEVDRLSRAWAEVAVQHPSMGRYLLAGETFTAWGKALFTSYAVFARRLY